MIRRRAVGITTALLCAVAVSHAAQPVARVLEAHGTVTAQQPNRDPRPVAAFGTVYLGDRLVTGEGSAVVLAFRENGRLERIRGPRTVEVTRTGCMPRRDVEAVEVAAAQQTLAERTVRRLPPVTVGGVTVLRGDDDKQPDQAVVPIPRSTVLGTRPEFRWPPVPQAVEYELTVYHNGEDIGTVRTRSTSVALAAERELIPGREYVWEVTAWDADGVDKLAWDGEFQVATPDTAAQAAQFAPWSRGSDVPLLVLAVLWYEQAGLVTEALAATQRLADLVPHEAEYHDQLAKLLRRAGRFREARQAHQRAEALRTEAGQAAARPALKAAAPEP